MKPSVFALAAAAALLTTPMRPAQAAPRTKPIVILVHGAFAEIRELECGDRPAQQGRLRNDRGCQSTTQREGGRGRSRDAHTIHFWPGRSRRPFLWRAGDHRSCEWAGECEGARLCGRVRARDGGIQPVTFGQVSGKHFGKCDPGGRDAGWRARSLYQTGEIPDAVCSRRSEGTGCVDGCHATPRCRSGPGEPSGVPSWKSLPSYMIYGTGDRNIPPAAMDFMAQRARMVRTVAINGASHALMISHPAEVVSMIEMAASSR